MNQNANVKATALHLVAMHRYEDALEARAKGDNREARNLIARAFYYEREAAREAKKQNALPAFWILMGSCAVLGLESERYQEAREIVADILDHSKTCPAHIRAQAEIVRQDLLREEENRYSRAQLEISDYETATKLPCLINLGGLKWETPDVHVPNPLNHYKVLPHEYGGHYNFSGDFENAWCLLLWISRMCHDDWSRGGMARRTTLELDAATGIEIARGPLEALQRSFKVFGIHEVEGFVSSTKPFSPRESQQR